LFFLLVHGYYYKQNSISLIKGTSMPEGLPELDIRNALAELAPVDTWRIKGPVILSRQCNIFRAQSPDHPMKIAIKIYHAMELRAADIQYQALEFYHPLFLNQNDPFATPKPLGYLPQHGLVLMEWVDAPNLWRCLWGTLFRPTVRFALLRRTGAWLRRFHEHGGINSGEIHTAHYRQKIVNILAKSDDTKKLLEQDTLFCKALDLLHDQESLLKCGGFACVPLHGDFTPSNILMSATRRVTGIDIFACRQGPVMEDITRMMVYLSVAFPFPDNGRRETQALLEGYGEDIADADSAGFSYIFLYQYLQRWIRLSQRTSAFPLSIFDRWALARVKRSVSALCQLSAFQTSL
jgi:hypothetical protein